MTNTARWTFASIMFGIIGLTVAQSTRPQPWMLFAAVGLSVVGLALVLFGSKKEKGGRA